MGKKVHTVKPDFICIGYHKAGTNWLYNNLYDHPEFSMPAIKELDYLLEGARIPKYTLWRLIFDRTTEHKFKAMRLLEYLKNSRPRHPKTNKFYIKYFLNEHTDNWYRNLFDSEKISGDISPTYSFLDDKAVRDVFSRYPDTKIIIILREPVSRIWSYMRMSINRQESISKYSSAQLIELSNQIIKQQIEYKALIKRWNKYFENVLVLFYDEIKDNPGNLMSQVYSFLGASNTSFESNFQKEIVFKGSNDECPKDLKRHLTEYYFPIVTDFYKNYNVPYVEKWLNEYSRVLS